MAFNVDKLAAGKFASRTADIDVPDLANFFDEGEKPVFTVRALTAREISEANDESGKHKLLSKMQDALGKGTDEGRVDAAKAALGIDEAVPEDLAKRISQTVCGLVAPKLDRHSVVRLFEFWPMVGYQVSNKILELTGLGADVGKPGRSTKKST